jgi:hypothetical protein
MKKFWMMGGAIIAATVAAMIWNSAPVRSSQNLLSKAQSEFATKARDALKQRQMAQAPIVSTPTATPKSIPLPPDVFPLLEPVATAPVAVSETSVEVAALETPTVTPASLDTALSRDSLSSPAILPAPAPLPAPAIEDAPAARAPQMASLPEEPKAPVLPRRIDVASMAEVANAEPPAVTRTFAEPQRQYRAERKTRHVQRKRRTHDVYRSEYRSERAPRYSTPYNLETLRARAPEIAAAIARYM